MDHNLLLMTLLITKHFITDFVLQGEYQFKNKGIYGHPGGVLHAVITGIGTTIALCGAVLFGATIDAGSFLVALLCEMVVHYHTDWAKIQINQRWGLTHNHPCFWNLLGFDQWIHYITYIWIVWYVLY